VQQHEHVLGIEGTGRGFPSEIDDPQLSALTRNLSAAGTSAGGSAMAVSGGGAEGGGGGGGHTLGIVVGVGMVSFADGERIWQTGTINRMQGRQVLLIECKVDRYY
jgi:hypothetical protein